MRKLLKIFGILIGLVVVAGGAALYFFDLDQVINAQKDKYLPELEKLLGRKVQAGQVKTKLLPVLGAELHDIVIAGRNGGDEPLLKIDKVEFRANLWKAITSAGQNVELDAFVVDGLTVNLVREADGTLSYQDVVDRLQSGPPPEEKPKPLDPQAKAFLQNLHLKRIALEKGRFHLVDKATGGAPAETSVNDLLVEADDFYLTQAIEVHVAAGVLAPQRNFDLKVKVGPFPIGQADAPVPVHSVALKSEGVDLSALVPYVGGALPVRFTSAKLSSDLRVDDPLAAKGPIKVDGSLKIEKLVLADPQPGQAFDLAITPKVTFDPHAGKLDLTGFSLALDDMTVSATGQVEGIGAYPEFKDVKVTTEKLDLGRLQAMLPPIKAALPPGAVVDGPLGLGLTASGTSDAQDVDLHVNLDHARIHLDGKLEKPAGTALNTGIQAHLSPNSLDLKKLELNVGDLKLALSGTVKDFQHPSVDLHGGTGRFDINGPVRLLPEVAKSIPPDVKVAGQAEIGVDLTGNKSSVDAKVLLGLYGADLAVPGTTVKGTGTVEATAKGDPARALALALDAALSGLTVDAGEAFHKPAGAPLEVKLRAQRAADRLDVPELLVHLGPLNLHGGGSIATAGAADLKITLDRFAVSDLAAMLPALRDTPAAGSQVGLTAAVSGDPAQLGSLKVAVSDLYFAKGKSSLTGTLTAENLVDAPRIRFDLNAPVLDVDELFPPGPPQPEAKSEPAKAPPLIVKKIDAQGRITVGHGVARKFPFNNFTASLTMKNGVAKFDKLDLDSYDGHFSAAPTSVDVGSAQPAFDAHVAMKDVNADRLLTEQASLPHTLSGRMSTEIALSGKGAGWDQLSKTLSGDLGMALANGRFEKLDFGQALLGNVARQLPMLKLPASTGSTALRDLAARFEVADGQMKLKQPLKAMTAQGPLELEGGIGLDASLHLTGHMTIDPAAIAALTANKVRPAKAIPVALKLGGTLTHPEISGVEAEALVALLTTELAKSLGAEKLLEAQKQAEAAAAKAKAEAEKRVADAKAQAQKAANDAKAKADELAAKAKAEAEKKKKEAKKKAEEEAKKALKGVF